MLHPWLNQMPTSVETFNKKNILGNVADRTHKITMTVDGRPSQQFGNLLLQDGQQIVVKYTTVGRRR